MKDKRPRLDNPKEFALIRSIYFEKDYRKTENIDSIEKLERMESKQRNLKNNTR